jgi:hypothetical protein
LVSEVVSEVVTEMAVAVVDQPVVQQTVVDLTKTKTDVPVVSTIVPSAANNRFGLNTGPDGNLILEYGGRSANKSPLVVPLPETPISIPGSPASASTIESVTSTVSVVKPIVKPLETVDLPITAPNEIPQSG